MSNRNRNSLFVILHFAKSWVSPRIYFLPWMGTRITVWLSLLGFPRTAYRVPTQNVDCQERALILLTFFSPKMAFTWNSWSKREHSHGLGGVSGSKFLRTWALKLGLVGSFFLQFLTLWHLTESPDWWHEHHWVLNTWPGKQGPSVGLLKGWQTDCGILMKVGWVPDVHLLWSITKSQH